MDLNKLPIKPRVQILNLPCEGSSLRSISRISDLLINAVSKLLAEAGIGRSMISRLRDALPATLPQRRLCPINASLHRPPCRIAIPPQHRSDLSAASPNCRMVLPAASPCLPRGPSCRIAASPHRHIALPTASPHCRIAASPYRRIAAKNHVPIALNVNRPVGIDSGETLRTCSMKLTILFLEQSPHPYARPVHALCTPGAQ